MQYYECVLKEATTLQLIFNPIFYEFFNKFQINLELNFFWWRN